MPGEDVKDESRPADKTTEEENTPKTPAEGEASAKGGKYYVTPRGSVVEDHKKALEQKKGDEETFSR